MESSRPTRTASRDYQSLSSTPWTLLDTLYSRRSHRKYLPVAPDDVPSAQLGSFLDAACDARDAVRADLIALTEPALVDTVKVAANRGVAGKINMWLPKMPLAGLILLDVPADDVRSERPDRLLKAVIAAHDALLWLTEREMGTCWLAGISEREVRKAAGLGGDSAVPAVVSFGRPALGVPSPVSVGGVTYRMMSRRRKPLGRIAGAEDTLTPFEMAPLDPGGFAASGEGVEGLVDRLNTGGARGVARAPLPLAVEICLEAARIAPSGNNAQDWFFVAVTDARRLERLHALCGGDGTGGWQAAIIAAGKQGRFETLLLDRPFWAIDVPIAISQLSLAAVSAGFGCEVVTEDLDEEAVRDLARMSGGMRVAGVVGLV